MRDGLRMNVLDVLVVRTTGGGAGLQERSLLLPHWGARWASRLTGRKTSRHMTLFAFQCSSLRISVNHEPLEMLREVSFVFLDIPRPSNTRRHNTNSIRIAQIIETSGI